MEHWDMVHNIHWNILEAGSTHVWGVILSEFICRVHQCTCVTYLWSMFVWIIVKKDLCGVLLSQKMTISPKRHIFNTLKTNNFAWVCGSSGFKIFLSRFWVDSINFSYSDDHLPKIYFVFSSELWYKGCSADVVIDETENHLHTILISEAP